jgi:iron complex transport system substrate-binding protein
VQSPGDSRPDVDIRSLEPAWRNSILKKTRLYVYCLLVVFAALPMAAGQAHGAEKTAQRIVSLGPDMTEQLFLLGEDRRLVGRTSYCIRPPAAKKIPAVASSVEVNLEKVVGLRPDVVLTTPLTPKRYARALEEFGIRVLLFPMPKNFEDLCGSFLRLATLVDKGEEAQNMVDKARQRVKALSAKVAGGSRPKVFVQVGAKPLFTMSEGTLVHDYIQLAGGRNIGADSGVGYFDYETVLQRNPDIILIVLMGIQGEQERKKWQEFPYLEAVKNNRIYIVDAYRICSPTPRSFVPMLEHLIELFHPGLE